MSWSGLRACIRASPLCARARSTGEDPRDEVCGESLGGGSRRLQHFITGSKPGMPAGAQVAAAMRQFRVSWWPGCRVRLEPGASRLAVSQGCCLHRGDPHPGQDRKTSDQRMESLLLTWET